MKREGLLYLFLLLSIPVSVNSQERTPLIPVKLTTPPVIDGVLSEDVWTGNKGISDFRTFIPDFGKELPFKTFVWLAYDEENIYFAFRCYDDEPDRIKVSVDARDKIRQDDWVCINLDSFNDQQALYCIYANANGIQMDTRFAAGKEDLGMDLVYYTAGTIDSLGYSVEFRIPLKSLRFSNKEPVMMAAFLERYVSRLSTNASFPHLAGDQGYAFMTQLQPIRYDGVKHYKLFEAIPAVTYSYKGEQDAGKMSTTENKPDAGLTLKYGLTSQLILDATLNPDFSQVEADAGQVDVNLRYELYYPEKRPFFQEGNENFQLGATGISAQDPVIEFVHTRNIVNPLAGVKLSGKMGIKNSMSLLYAADMIPEPDDEVYGKYAHFPVIRYKRSLKQDSYIGLLGSSVIKDISSNYVYGADGIFRLNKSTQLEFHTLLSNTNDTAAGIENKTGHSASLYFHSEQRNIDYALTAQDISEYFISQTGFITRTGVSVFSGTVIPRLYTDSKLFRRFDFAFHTGQLRDNIYDMWETYNYLSVTSWLGGTIRATIRYNYSTEIYGNEKFNTSGFQAVLTGRIGTKINGTLSYRNRNAVYYTMLEQGYGNTFTGDIRYLPFEKLHTQLSLTYQDLYLKSDNSKVFDYLLVRGRVTYQMNKYLFFRAIAEYNSYRESLTTDFLASFTYIPGTVFHIGYGSLYEKKTWDGTDYTRADTMMEMKRGFFAKVSYLFRV